MVSTQVRDTTNNASVAHQSETYPSGMDDIENYYGFYVSFDCPVYLETHKQYKVQSIVDDPISWSRKQGQTFVESEGVRFTFSDTEDGTADGTSVVHGQFPAFLLS